MNPIFQLVDLSVNYGSVRAIESVSFELLSGQALGLIGVNGAGKTTTIRALLGMVKLKSGGVHLLGASKINPGLFARLGFAPEEGGAPDYLTGREYLNFMGGFKISNKGDLKKNAEDLLAWFELDPNKLVRDYSKGMRRRLILAQAFIGRPELLILDEPLNGLDPLMILKLRDRLQSYLKAGGSVLYSSHILAELENSCTQIVIMNCGSVICRATVPDLVNEFGSVEKAFSAKVGGA